MKPIVRSIQTALLCLMLLSANKLYAQFFPVSYTTTQGQCVYMDIDSMLALTGLTLDTFAILSNPSNGQLTPGGRPNLWVYCPDTAFTGTDQAVVYICISGGTFPICDTLYLTFVVQPTSSCNLSVSLQPGPCAGPLPSLMAVVTGGTPPYTYFWSDSSITDVVCNLFSGSNYCVTVMDANGCTASACQLVGGGCQMVTSIYLDSSGCLITIVNGGTPPYSYQWSDGSSGSTLCNISPLNTYYVVVTDSSGCAFTALYGGGGCQLTSTITQSGGCLSLNVTGGSPPYYYTWNTNETTQTICPNTAGTFCVNVTDSQGCNDVQCATIGGGCQITVTLVADSVNRCLTAVATGGNPPYQFIWSDGSAQSSVCNIVPGDSYCVSVFDANGCAGSACNGTSLPCAFTYTQGGPALQNLVVFAASFDQQLNPASIIWDLGDGNMGTGFQLTHIYNACGLSYTVEMSLLDSSGNILCSNSQYVYVYCDSFNRYCQAYFTSYQDSADNMTFHFVDQSVYNPVAYAWDFGDGNSSTLQNPSHTYTTPGIYYVCLVTTDATGCASTYCQTVNAGNVQVQDLSAYLYHYTTITPGFPLWANLSYCNYGTTLMDGTVEYRYPSGTTFVSATPPPTSHDATQRLLTFDFTGLLPGSCGYIAIDLLVDVSLPLGSIAYDTMWVKPISGDINPSDNISNVTETVTGSWDPNDKAVSPKGIGDDGEIPVSTQTLSYKIRFQNTGTAPAQNVVIRDALDSPIDLTTVAVPDASHEHTTQIIGNELVVTFNNIMLPDSNANEPASHGYIQVIAHLKPGLSEGTQIQNTAEIYFDFNEPVITNTVVNTLKDATGIRSIAGLEFSIVPNPAQDEIVLSGNFSRNSAYEVMNELGQILLSGKVDSGKTKIPIGNLNAGVYFVRIKSSGKTGAQRLMVTK